MDAIKTAKVWIGERKGITSPIHVSQYDTAWTFQFKVYKDDLIYEPENAVSVVFTGKKSDDTVFAVPADFEDGVATVASTVAMTSASGIVECELRFSESEETVGTANFDMVVEASPIEGGTPSEDDFTTLQTMVDAVAQSAARAETAADTAAQEVLAETPEMVYDWLEANVTPETGYVIDSSLTVQGAAADAKATGDKIGDLKGAVDEANTDSSFLVPIEWESGSYDTATGAETENANYSRTAEYIPTTAAAFVLFSAGANLTHFDLVDGSYVRKANNWVTANSQYAIKKEYGYFRIAGATKIANHPENNYKVYQYTKAQIEVNTLRTKMLGKYKAPIYFSDGFSASWTQTGSGTTLTLQHDKQLNFEGFAYPATENIETNDIYTAASQASSLTTVDGDDIVGSNFAIIYNIATKEISIVTASTYVYNDIDEIVLFAVAWNSFVSGAILDAEMRRRYERNITRLVQAETDIDHLESVIATGANVPDYWFTHLATKITDVQARDVEIGDHGDSFVWVTDLHYNSNDRNSAGATQYILNNSSVNKVIIGGDIANGATASKEDALAQLIACRNDFRRINPYYLRGNHDNNTEITSPTPEKAISDSELYGLTLKPIEDKIVCDKTLHYYFDNEVQLIRYICLDTGHPDTNVISDAQITWMKGKITELDPGWTVVVLTHQYYQNAAEAQRDGNGDKILAGLNDIYDVADAVIACVICGHSHRDKLETTAKGFPVICTTCDVRGGEGGGLTRTKNTYTEQAFDVFHIDTTARMIYATRIGAGEDREVAY